MKYLKSIIFVFTIVTGLFSQEAVYFGDLSFNYSGSSQRTRATVVVVKYFDKNLRSFAYERVSAGTAIINKYGSITKNIEAFACTSRSQAKRVAKWLLYTEENETEVLE